MFTSETLSDEGDFGYLMRMLGLRDPARSTVGSPFDIEEQVFMRALPRGAKIKTF